MNLRREMTPQPITAEQLVEINLYHANFIKIVIEMSFLASIFIGAGFGNFVYSLMLESQGGVRMLDQWRDDLIAEMTTTRVHSGGWSNEQLSSLAMQEIGYDLELVRVITRIVSGSIASAASIACSYDTGCPLSYEEHQFEKLTQEQADVLIEKLQQQISKLKPYYNTYYKFLWLILLFCAAYSFFLTSDNRVSVIEFVLFTSAILRLAIRHDASIFNYEKINKVISPMLNDLNSVINMHQYNLWHLNKKYNLAASYFSLDVEDYGKISAAVVAHIIKRVFVRNGIEVTLDDNQLRLSANVTLKKELLTKIKRNITDALLSMKNIKFLRKEIAKIGDRLGVYFDATIQISTEGMPGCEFVVFNNENISKAHMDKLKLFFSDKLVVNNRLLVITYKDVVAEVSFKELYLTLDKIPKNIPNRSVSSTSYLLKTVDQKLAKRGRSQAFKTEQSKALSHTDTAGSKIVPVKSELESVGKDKDKSKERIDSAFASSSSSNKVYEFMSDDLPCGMFFVTSEIDKNRFPAKECYKAFKRQIQAPKIAASCGEQGFKSAFGWSRDNNKVQFQFQKIIKLKGKWGDCRVYCEKRNLPDHKVLYVAKGINNTAHQR